MVKTTKKTTKKIPKATVPQVTKPKVDQVAIRQRVTDAMVQALIEGTPPWRQPWSGGTGQMAPCNFMTHRHYRGINPLLLLFSSMTKGLTSPYWGTQISWEKQHAKVRQGQEPTHVLLYMLVPVIENGKKKKNVQGNDVLHPFMREYPLYNFDQLDVPEGVLDKCKVKMEVRNTEDIFAPAEALIEATNAEIHYKGVRAYYQLDVDKIFCPPKETFDSMADFYETVGHELMHWCSGKGRIAQKQVVGNQYAFNELVAEIGACILLLELGVPAAEQMLAPSAAYVKSWAERMGNDPKFIFDAAVQAGKNVSYILAFQPKKKKRAA